VTPIISRFRRLSPKLAVVLVCGRALATRAVAGERGFPSRGDVASEGEQDGGSAPGTRIATRAAPNVAEVLYQIRI